MYRPFTLISETTSLTVTLSRYYSTAKTPQNTILKTTFRPPIKNNPSLSTKRHVVFSKTTRGFQQNDTSHSIKRYVVFGDDEVFSTPSAVTLVTAKNQNS